ERRQEVADALGQPLGRHVEPDDVGMRAGFDLLARHARATARARLALEQHRERTRRRGLPGAGRPFEQISVMESPRLQGGAQALDHGGKAYHAGGGFAGFLTYKGDMGILDRISRLVSSNVNAAIDKMSDPGKQIDQLVIEMEEQLRAARKE